MESKTEIKPKLPLSLYNEKKQKIIDRIKKHINTYLDTYGGGSDYPSVSKDMMESELGYPRYFDDACSQLLKERFTEMILFGKRY